MACSKIRKVYPENRHFKDEWTDQYLFILLQGSTKPLLCLLCVETVALIKSGNIKRHYDSKHRSFEEKYPQKSEVRAWKISELSMRGLRVSSHTHLQASNVQMNAHLRLDGFWGNIKKISATRLNAAAETLVEGKQRDELCEKIKQIPM